MTGALFVTPIRLSGQVGGLLDCMLPLQHNIIPVADSHAKPFPI